MTLTRSASLARRPDAPRVSRRTPVVVAVAAVVLLAVTSGTIRDSLLRAAGWALVVDDALQAADVVVVGVDAGGVGVLEAADLVQRGVAPRAAVFADPPDGVDWEFIRRGVPYEDAAARSVRQLRALGVLAVDYIPRAVASTQAEGDVLPGWCVEHHLRAVVVVSTPDHSRRLRRVLHRAMRDQPTRVIVRASRYGAFDPDRWWLTRDGIRIQVIESQKLLLDIVRHPLS